MTKVRVTSLRQSQVNRLELLSRLFHEVGVLFGTVVRQEIERRATIQQKVKVYLREKDFVLRILGVTAMARHFLLKTIKYLIQLRFKITSRQTAPT